MGQGAIVYGGVEVSGRSDAVWESAHFNCAATDDYDYKSDHVMTPAALLFRLTERDEAVIRYAQAEDAPEGQCHIIDRRGVVTHRHNVDKAFNKAREAMVQVACQWPSGNEIYRPAASFIDAE